MSNKKIYRRGELIQVDFSPQIGSEIKGPHFAIVLSKKDNRSNNLLTVVPLTSKEKKYHINLGNWIKNDAISVLNEYIQELKKETDELNIKTEYLQEQTKKMIDFTNKLNNQVKEVKDIINSRNSESYDADELLDKIAKLNETIKERKEKIKKTETAIDDATKSREALLLHVEWLKLSRRRMETLKDQSFAMINQISTIDKARIKKTIYRKDLLHRLKAPDYVMDLIDLAIINKFTFITEKIKKKLEKKDKDLDVENQGNLIDKN